MHKAKEFSLILMAIFLMENGSEIKPMVKVNTKVQIQEGTIQECGSMIYSMVKEMNTGRMEATMREILNQVKRVAMVCNNGLMAPTMLDNGKAI